MMKTFSEKNSYFKGMHAIFQKKGKKMFKKGKILVSLGKNVQNLKIF